MGFQLDGTKGNGLETQALGPREPCDAAGRFSLGELTRVVDTAPIHR